MSDISERLRGRRSLVIRKLNGRLEPTHQLIRARPPLSINAKPRPLSLRLLRSVKKGVLALALLPLVPIILAPIFSVSANFGFAALAVLFGFSLWLASQETEHDERFGFGWVLLTSWAGFVGGVLLLLLNLNL